MLAQLEKPTNDFHALARYLVNGRSKPPSPDRVAWTMARNLPSDDPLLAADYMTATAEMSKRCRKACYHTIIAWAPEEHPSPEVMQEIVVRTLELAGLAEHQVLVMGHGDKAHAHLHMMVNRVHPDTGRAWSTSQDYRRFDRIMQLLSEEYRFRHVPAHSFAPEATAELMQLPDSSARYAASAGADTARPQWSRSTARLIGEAVSERLDQAATWDDVEFALADRGLTLEAKGQGLVAGTRDGYVKLSALGLTSSAKALEKRFGGAFTVWKAQRRVASRYPALIDEVDLAKGLARWGLAGDGAVRAAVAAARARRRAWLAEQDFARQLEEELKEALRASTMLSAKAMPAKERAGRSRSLGRGNRDR